MNADRTISIRWDRTFWQKYTGFPKKITFGVTVMAGAQKSQLVQVSPLTGELHLRFTNITVDLGAEWMVAVYTVPQTTDAISKKDGWPVRIGIYGENGQVWFPHLSRWEATSLHAEVLLTWQEAQRP